MANYEYDPADETVKVPAQELQELELNQTPNQGLIEDPKARKVLNNVIAGVGLVLGTAMVVDIATPAWDISAWTEPIFIGYAYIAAAFGFAVTRPNYPKF